MADTATGWQEHERRHADLCARYGKPELLPDEARIIGYLGLPADPNWSAAFRYESAEACEAFAESNLRNHGHRSWGPFVTEAGIIGVIEVRRA